MKKSFILMLLLLPIATFSKSFQLMSGQTIPLSSLKGKWVFINYWASWCHSCLEEIPKLNQFYQRHSKNEVALFAINYDGISLDKQQELIQATNILYPSLSKDPAPEFQLGDIRGVPVTFVFNPDGQLADTLYGEQNTRALEQIIAGR